MLLVAEILVIVMLSITSIRPAVQLIFSWPEVDISDHLSVEECQRCQFPSLVPADSSHGTNPVNIFSGTENPHKMPHASKTHRL